MFVRVISLLCLVVQAIQGILTIKFAGAHLAIDDMKIWVLLAASIPYLSVFDFGISSTLVREVSIIKGSAKLENEKNREKAVVIKTLMVGVVSAVMLLFSIFVIVKLMFGLISNVMLFFVISISVRIFCNVLLAIVVIEKNVATERLIRLYSSVLFLFSVYVLLNYRYGVFTLPISNLIQSGVIFVCVAITCRKLLFSSLSYKFNVNYFKTVFPHLKNWTLTAIPALFVFNFTIYAIATVLPANQIVLYSIMHQMFFGILSLSSIPTMIALPGWSRLFAGGVTDQLRYELIKTVNEVVLVVFTASIFILYWFRPIVSFIKSDMLVVGSQPIFLFSVLIFIESIQTTLTAACFSCKETNFIRITLIAAILSVILTYLGARFVGLNGAILGMLLSQLVSCDFFNIKKALHFFDLKRTFFIALSVVGVLSLSITVAFYEIVMELKTQYGMVYYHVFIAIETGILIKLFRKRTFFYEYF